MKSERFLFNKYIFIAYRALSRAYFHLPILLVFLLAKMPNLMWSELMLAIYAIAIAAFSTLNTFLMKKSIKLKYIIATGEICKGIGLFLIAFFSSKILYIAIGQFIGGLGFALCIGTDSSLLRSQHLNSGQAEYQKTESNSMSLVFVVIFIAGNIGSFLYKTYSALPFYISIVTTIAAAIIILFFYEVHETPFNISQNTSSTSNLQNKVANISSILIFWICYYVIVRATVLALFIGFFPLLLRDATVSVEYFGFFLGSFSLCAALSARYITKDFVDCHKFFASTFIAAVLSIGIAVFIFSNSKLAWLIGMGLLGTAAGVVRPLVLSEISQKISTILQTKIIMSRMETIYGITNGLLLLIGGWIVSFYNLKACLLFMSIIPIIFAVSVPLQNLLKLITNRALHNKEKLI